MKLLRLTQDGSIDDSSHDAYLKHLESIRTHIHARLYEMLRFPETAYREGGTIYDSILTEWHGVLDRRTWETCLDLRLLTPNFDRELRFSFQGDLRVTQTSANRWYAMGALYCLEVTMAENGMYEFCFLNIAREELRIECRAYTFEEVHIQNTSPLQ